MQLFLYTFKTYELRIIWKMSSNEQFFNIPINIFFKFAIIFYESEVINLFTSKMWKEKYRV